MLYLKGCTTGVEQLQGLHQSGKGQSTVPGIVTSAEAAVGIENKDSVHAAEAALLNLESRCQLQFLQMQQRRAQQAE